MTMNFASAAFYPDYIGSPSTADARSVQLHRWSMLLHYSCVKCPVPDIQQRCSALSPATQKKLERFFTVLISRPTIDREHLSAAITAAVLEGGGDHGTHSLTNSSCSESESADVASPLRIVRHPWRTPLVQTTLLSTSSPLQMGGGGAGGNSNASIISGIGSLSIGGGGGVLSSTASGNSGNLIPMGMSPMADRNAAPKCSSTPRTKMMDDWNLEIRQLRAQIDTERDERLFLEGQLKQSEEKISALSEFCVLIICCGRTFSTSSS